MIAKPGYISPVEPEGDPGDDNDQDAGTVHLHSAASSSLSIIKTDTRTDLNNKVPHVSLQMESDHQRGVISWDSSIQS